MPDAEKTREQLIGELLALRQRIGQLEASATARQRAQEALPGVEARYGDFYAPAPDMFLSIVEGSPYGILIHQDAVIQYVNQAGCRCSDTPVLANCSGEIPGRP